MLFSSLSLFVLVLSCRTIHIMYLVICVRVFFHTKEKKQKKTRCIVIVICLDVKINFKTRSFLENDAIRNISSSLFGVL